MIIDMKTELRGFTYITNLYKCISNYHLMGHQIGRKVGDMLEILTMGILYRIPDLKNHLDTEGKLEGYTTAGHKVEFGFFENPKLKKGLFGAIECKCVGVEETKLGKNNTITLHPGETFKVSLSAQWMDTTVTVTCRLISFSSRSAVIELTDSSDTAARRFSLNQNDNVKLIIDENGQFLNTTPHGNMLVEIPGIIRICKTIRMVHIDDASCTFALYNCLTGPQTIEKAKQASLVAMDLRKKIDGHWGKEDIDSEQRKMTFIHVICEFSHWEEKSRNVIAACIDHNLVIPDAILIYAFDLFEIRFGTDYMLNYISKRQFEINEDVQNIIYEILNTFENHILYDIANNYYVQLTNRDNSLCIEPLLS